MPGIAFDDGRIRCGWGGDWTDDLMRHYHDDEWGMPVREESTLFELITLEGAQAGLSWTTILRKRDGYRRAFAAFEPSVVAAYGEPDVERLLADPGIVRHRGKIESTISNAHAVLALRESGGLVDLVWSFVDGRPKVNAWRRLEQIPAVTDESTALSRELLRRGFRFVGPTTMYAFMQAVGLVNDHTVDCFRYTEVQEGPRDG
jgi:DNA-3-methyladenine glycosylase I